MMIDRLIRVRTNTHSVRVGQMPGDVYRGSHGQGRANVSWKRKKNIRVRYYANNRLPYDGLPRGGRRETYSKDKSGIIENNWNGVDA